MNWGFNPPAIPTLTLSTKLEKHNVYYYHKFARRATATCT